MTIEQQAKEPSMDDLTKCPQCGGPADNGHDRCIPPSAYMCSKCCVQEEAERKGVMDDRSLLERAARAAGYAIGQWSDEYEAFVFAGNPSDFWNPLAGPDNLYCDSDGDALRLAVKLDLSIRLYHAMGLVSVYGKQHYGSDEQLGTDPYAATRRAITRAAAELSKE